MIIVQMMRVRRSAIGELVYPSCCNMEVSGCLLRFEIEAKLETLFVTMAIRCMQEASSDGQFLFSQFANF